MEVSCRVAQKRWRLRKAKDWRLPLLCMCFISFSCFSESSISPLESALEEVTNIDKKYAKCVLYSAKAYNLSAAVILSILEVEGGSSGAVSKNNNGTTDFGVAQINTVRLPELSHFISDVSEIKNDTCTSIIAIGYIVSQHVKEYPAQFWTAVGAYHYRPDRKYPQHHYNYIYKVFTAYQKICKKYNSICSQLNY